MTRLEQFKDNLARSIYGQTVGEAASAGNCIQCGKPALPKCYSNAGRNEYYISGLCEECFDDITKEE